MTVRILIDGPAILVLGGGLISSVAGLTLGVWALERETLSKRKKIATAGRIKLLIAITFLGGLCSLVGGMWGATRANQFQSQLAGYATGADSICYLRLGFWDPVGQTWHHLIAHHGLYGLHDVDIWIVDLDKNDAAKASPSAQSFAEANSFLHYDEVSPGESHFPKSWVSKPLNSNQARYDIRISTQYSALLEKLRVQQVNGNWKIAMRIIKEPTNTVVFECRDLEFPQSTEWPATLNPCYPWHY